MVIGTSSTSTLLEIFKIGVTEVVRKMGLPSELVLETDKARMTAKSKDFNQRIEYFRIDFTPKEGFEPESITHTLDEHKIPSQVRFVSDFPRTETGKPKKFELRAHADVGQAFLVVEGAGRDTALAGSPDPAG